MAGRFELSPTLLDGLILVTRKRLGDERGWLERFFCADELRQAGWQWDVAQLNRTMTEKRGTVRGMHFQHPPHEEAKFVTCLRGEVFDVAVDIRPGSSTYGKWHGAMLSAENAKSLFIPPGFAHGFQTMTDDVEMFYVHSAPYAPDSEDGLRADDIALGIDWLLPITTQSERDKGFRDFDVKAGRSAP
jgi:dTDP-4-dehydrorhamnose 3,5-epimerase